MDLNIDTINYINLNNYTNYNPVCTYCINTWKDAGYKVKEWNEESLANVIDSNLDLILDLGHEYVANDIIRLKLSQLYDNFLIMSPDVILYGKVESVINLGKDEDPDFIFGVDNDGLMQFGTLHYSKRKDNPLLQEIIDAYKVTDFRNIPEVYSTRSKFFNLNDTNVKYIKNNGFMIHNHLCAWNDNRYDKIVYLNKMPKDSEIMENDLNYINTYVIFNIDLTPSQLDKYINAKHGIRYFFWYLPGLKIELLDPILSEGLRCIIR